MANKYGRLSVTYTMNDPDAGSSSWTQVYAFYEVDNGDHKVTFVGQDEYDVQLSQAYVDLDYTNTTELNAVFAEGYTTTYNWIVPMTEVDADSGIEFPIPIANGGTGATTAAQALTNLGAASATALNTLTNTVAGKADASHTHSNYATVTALNTLSDEVDGKANASHTHDYAASSHTHTVANITDLQTTLDGKAASSHTHNYAGSSSAGGSATSAIKLATARTINGKSFDGTANITFSNLYPTVVPASADLDDYTQSGLYYSPSNANVATMTNCPTTKSFFMEVGKHAGTYQRIVEYMVSSPRIYFRNMYNGTWGAWYEERTSANATPACTLQGEDSTQTIPADTLTKLTLTTMTTCTDSSAFSVSGNGIKVAKAGYYAVSGSAYIDPSTAAGARGVYICKNGSEIASARDGGAGGLGGGVSVAPKIVSLAAGDIITLYGRSFSVAGTAYPTNAATYLTVIKM